MQEKELAYLQIVPPSWMLNNDPLIEQINHLGKLYSEGRLVWAAIVQANKFLFDEDKAFSCPADIVYDPTGRTPSYQLTNVASQLYALKHTTPDDPELRRYAEHVTDEQERHIQRVPSALSALPLITTGIFLWRPHLPNGKLSMNIIPILVHDDCEGIVTMLPARFWEGSYLSSIVVKPPSSGGGYKAIVKCDEFCYTHLTIFNVLHSTVKLRLNCEYAVT